MSKQLTYETKHISLLRGSTMSSKLHFCLLRFFFSFLFVIQNGKMLQEIVKKGSDCLGRQYYYFDLLEVRVCRAHKT